MKVYTVEGCASYENDEVLGIFSTKEKADTARDELAAGKHHYCEILVCEWTLDDEYPLREGCAGREIV